MGSLKYHLLYKIAFNGYIYINSNNLKLVFIKYYEFDSKIYK